uniref:Uncharacterized protein B2H10.040 n=1 Tax=Neurospora crassa TaxID=5141 RepID=Q6MFW0_NEUCS|nr:hypothetical protein [Neurospora crassa]
MTNTAGLVDNVGNNPDENGNVKAIRNMTRERQEMLQPDILEAKITGKHAKKTYHPATRKRVRQFTRDGRPYKSGDYTNGGLPIWDREAQRPVDPMPYLSFSRHFEDNQPIAGRSGGSGGSRTANAQKSGAANNPNDESPSGASGN